MSVRYLLPCSCGQEVPVETRQAGGTVTCACGQALVAPSLRGLRQLPVEESHAVARREWGVRQGAVMLCIVLAIGMGILGGGLWKYARGQAPVETSAILQKLHEHIESLTPVESYYEWLQHVRDTDLIQNPDADNAIRATRFVLLRRVALASWGVSGLLLLAAAVTAFWPRPVRR